MRKKVLLLGSGELGKELTISLQRLGQYIIAVDNYPNAPAMQVAHEFEVIDMLDGAALDAVVAKHKPDLIVPEIEAIRTDRFYEYERKGYTVIPSAKAANFTMNRKAIRDLAAKELGIKTAAYEYATTLDTFKNAVLKIGFPCVAKPLMSSSGKGQSTIKKTEDIENAWEYALKGSRGDLLEVIVEAFVKFNSEITLLTVTQKNGPTRFCPPIGHRQERGDYRESWQPCPVAKDDLHTAQQMAEKITTALGGQGVWGIEFFLTDEGVYFSELSPRPHDTGMVTLAGTQNLSEFELHARAILGLNIPEIVLEKSGVSAVILATKESNSVDVKGMETVLLNENTDLRIFGKPNTKPYRRMGVVLCSGKTTENMEQLKSKAMALVKHIQIN